MSSKYFAATALVAVTLISSCTSEMTISDVDRADAPSSTATAPVPPRSVPSAVNTSTPNILSSTVAKQAQVAICPVGADPDLDGPIDQARPFKGSPLLSAALDRQSGRVVTVGTSGGTWAFDVCTNTWARMSDSDDKRGGVPILVYDADSDLVVAFQHRARGYDVDTDTWTTYSDVPAELYGYLKDAIYDPVSGLIVIRDFVSSQMWAYDVDTDTWTSLSQGAITPPGRQRTDRGSEPIFTGQVHVYDADTDSLVLYLTDNFSGPGIWEGAGTEMTWTYDLRAGKWTVEDTVTPELNFGWVPGHGNAAYDETAQTTVVVADGVVAGYNAAQHEWSMLWEKSGPKHAYGQGTGPHNRIDHAIVYDPTNERVIVFGGSARMLDQEPFWVGMDDMWTFDTSTGTWTEILISSAP